MVMRPFTAGSRSRQLGRVNLVDVFGHQSDDLRMKRLGEVVSHPFNQYELSTLNLFRGMDAVLGWNEGVLRDVYN